MSWTKEEIKEMTGVLMRRAHGDGRDRQEVETICLLAETSIMNRESCERLMDKVEELKTDHAAEVEKLEGELVEQARLLGMGGEREAKLMAEVAALRERVRVLEEAVKQTPHDTMEFTGRCETWCRRCKLDAALAQPQPCKTCGGKGYETHALGWMPCPDCKPQQKEGE